MVNEPDTILYTRPESPTVADAIEESSISLIIVVPTVTEPVAFVALDDTDTNGSSKFPEYWTNSNNDMYPDTNPNPTGWVL